MEGTDSSLPLPALPYDTLRQGLATFQDRLVERHPVQALQETDADAERFQTLRDVYGTGMAARMRIEQQILERRGRLPPLPSSNLGSDVYFGRLGTFDCESYLGLEEFSAQAPADVHSQMEAICGLGTKPAKRGIL